MKIIFGTSNPKKVDDLKAIPVDGIEVLTLADVNISMPYVVEDGDTFEANARQKYDALRPLVPEKYLLVTEDSGLEIDALGNEPGVYSRRWNAERTEMSDDELIAKTIRKLEGESNRRARFVSAVAFGGAGIEPQELRGELTGEIIQQVDESGRIPGMPYRALFYVPHMHMMMHEMIAIPYRERAGNPTHRESSWLSMVNAIKAN